MPNTPSTLSARANALLTAARYEEALVPLAELAKLLPNDAATAQNLGLAFFRTRRLPQSIAWLGRAATLDPASAPIHFALAIACAEADQVDPALGAFLRAAQLDPKLAEAHGRAGDLLMRKGRIADARDAYGRAFLAAPLTSYGRLCKATAELAGGETMAAERLLQGVVADDPQNAEALLALGNALSELGRFDEARVRYEGSIAASPWQADAYGGLLRARRQNEADRPFLAEVEQRLDEGRLSARQQMKLHFAVGKGFDDLRDEARAMKHFDAANDLRKRFSPFDATKLRAGVDQLIARFTPAFFASYSAHRDRSEQTPVFVLGMPRSGTTLVERVISNHPQVAGGGELPFFAEHGPAWMRAAAQGKVPPDPSAPYLALLRQIAASSRAPNALRVTDKMPSNFFWIGLLHSLFPGARFVHCRRNAIDTCLSIYTTWFVEDWPFASDRRHLVLYYREYLRLMSHWRSVIPQSQLLDVEYEQVIADPEKTARELIAFLGLAWDDACLVPHENPTPVRTASKWQARQPIYQSSVERWRRYEAWLGELRELENVSRHES